MMNITKANFEDIVLTPHEKQLFKQFKNGKIIMISRDDAFCIRRFGLIEEHLVWVGSEQLPWDGTFVISDKGKHYLQYLKAARRKIQTDWIRYIITTAIAIAAFIKSFFF